MINLIVKALEDYGCRGVSVSGDNIRCQCPFHNPVNNTDAFSVTINEEKMVFNCHSCGSSGNLVKLLRFLTGEDKTECYEQLLLRIKKKKYNLDTLEKNARNIGGHRVEIDVPQKASDGKPLQEYLKHRSSISDNILLIDEIISKYELYYCDRGRYSNRIILPIQDNGIVGYANRSVLLKCEKKTLFQKELNIGKYLYGFDVAFGADNVIIVEGFFDVYQIFSYLVKNKLDNRFGVVSLMGHSLKTERIQKLALSFDKCYVMMDFDEAGINGGKKISKALSMKMKTVNLTEALEFDKDPGNSSMEELDGVFSLIV